MMLFVVCFCSKLKWSGKFNNSGDFPRQATFDFFDSCLLAKEKSLWYFCNGKKLKKR